MTKAKNYKLYNFEDTLLSSGVADLLSKAVGRKKSGVFAVQFVRKPDPVIKGPVLTIASMWTFRYNKVDPLDRGADHTAYLAWKETQTDTCHIEDIISGDMAWTGTVITDNDKLDMNYNVVASIRAVVLVEGFVFQVRETCDGLPYTDGLLHFEIDPTSDDYRIKTRSGLKQCEVVELFQGVPSALTTLRASLMDVGYIYHGGNILTLHHNGILVSEVDITLMGAL